MSSFSDTNILENIVCDNRIDLDALHSVYDKYVQEQRFVEAHQMLNHLQQLFPGHNELLHMDIGLSINEKDYTVAMQQIERLVARCCPDNGLLDAALAVRSKIHQDSTKINANREHPSLSLCMVVKNELAGLGACLNGAKELVDEIIVVDTGSVDRTKDVALIYGARLFNFKWRNDFAAARNYSLEKASGDWVLILDADEIIAAKDHDALRATLRQNSSGNIAYNVTTRNYTNLANTIGWHANDGSYKKYEAGSGWFPTRKVRLFPRSSDIRFRFPVHERVDPDILSKGFSIIDSRIPVHHYGYLNEEKKQKKARYYFKLGYAKLEQFGDDLEAVRELAIQAGQLEKWDEAVALWQKFINIKPDYAEAYINLSGVYWQMTSYEKALVSAKSALNIDPDSKEARYNVAVSLMYLDNLSEAIDRLRQLLAENPDYLVARFMLSIAYCFAGDIARSARTLEVCQLIMPKITIVMAVKNQIEKLKKTKMRVYENQLKQVLALIHAG